MGTLSRKFPCGTSLQAPSPPHCFHPFCFPSLSALLHSGLSKSICYQRSTFNHAFSLSGHPYSCWPPSPSSGLLCRYCLCALLSRHHVAPYLLLLTRSVVSNSLWPRGLQHARLPCPSLSPEICSNSCPFSWWCHPTISSSVIPFSSCLQSFPASGSFPVSWLFESGGQRIGASVSVLPVNIQGWSPLRLTGLLSLHSKGLLRVFSHTTVQKHRFFGAQLSLWSNSHPCMTTEENHSFDYMDLWQQSNVSAF